MVDPRVAKAAELTEQIAGLQQQIAILMTELQVILAGAQTEPQQPVRLPFQTATDVVQRQAPFLTFPVIGSKTATTWDLTEAHVQELEGLFPGHDVRQHCRAALAWVKANPRNRKTPSGMAGFLSGWLTREARRGGGGLGFAPAQARPRGGWQPLSGDPWVCPHVDRCGTPRICATAIELHKPMKTDPVFQLDPHGVPRVPGL